MQCSGYGFPAFSGCCTGSPHGGLGLAVGGRDYSLGWRLTPEFAAAPDISFGVKATRREAARSLVRPQLTSRMTGNRHWSAGKGP